MRIGLIEDNQDFRAEVAFHLTRAGHQIALESDGLDFDREFERAPCDLLVLDLGLPGEDGLSIAARVRVARPGTGIVMLTARSRLDERLDGLNEGADAYLSKPVDMRELVAVVASVGRRLRTSPTGQEAGAAWTLDPQTLSLVSPAGRSVVLTVNELALLQRLAAGHGAPVSRPSLAGGLGYTNPDFDDRRLEVAFSRLRQKIEAVEPGCSVVRSARGQGYLFAAALKVLPG